MNLYYLPVSIEGFRSFSGRDFTIPSAMITVSVRNDSMSPAHFLESHANCTMPEWSPRGMNATSTPPPSNLARNNLLIKLVTDKFTI